MASITIRDLDDDLKRRLRDRAAKNSRSIEEEAREILRTALGQPSEPRNLGQSIHAKFAELGGIDFAGNARTQMRLAPAKE